MIYHVLPGDAQVEAFRKCGIDGELIVFCEALIAGPVEAEDPEQFWKERAHFILTEYGEDEIDYHEKVAAELERLSDIGEGDEVNLWFEYEMFCSVNLWFCLDRLADSGADVYRVHPAVLSEADRWSGFGRMVPDDLVNCFECRVRLGNDDIELGRRLWQAFSSGDRGRIKQLGSKETRAFPYLREVTAAAADPSLPIEVLKQIRSEGISEFEKAFPEFVDRAGVLGYGDLQVKVLWDALGPA